MEAALVFFLVRANTVTNDTVNPMDTIHKSLLTIKITVFEIEITDAIMGKTRQRYLLILSFGYLDRYVNHTLFVAIEIKIPYQRHELFDSTHWNVTAIVS